MRVIVINTGTELLLGDVVNTHLSFIARQLLPLRLRVEKQLTVPDGEAIRFAVAENSRQCDLLFVTGGLGPTTDDLTRETVAELLALPLETNAELEQLITRRLARRHIRLTNRILRQAQVPRGARVLPNNHGTAPGLYLAANLNADISSPPIFLLPGPPRELEPMFLASVLPILREIVTQAREFEHRSYRIVGMGESYVEEAIGAQLLALPGIELGYCARMGEVDLRVIAAPEVARQADEIIRARLGNSIFSTTSETLESIIVRLLAERNATIATAESCTGGFLAHRLTNVPGASQVFRGGFVTYANEEKIRALDVSVAALEKFGAVSEQVAREMAEGARTKLKADFALATTGIAGPDGGAEAKPVGTAYFALASARETLVRHFFFPTDRETFKQLLTQSALNLLREALA